MMIPSTRPGPAGLLVALLASLIATATNVRAQAPAFTFEEVREGIYHARGTGALGVGSHAAVIVNEEDVLVVDSHISPAAATALLDELRAITDKPVRYVVNTHFHFDHAHGNQVYPESVHVIGHEFTHRMLESGESMGTSYQRFQEWLAQMPGYTEEGLIPTPPNTTLSERMTLYRGDREIRLIFFGRGHTGGDIVVHLPAERVLISGDLLLPGLPFAGDGYPLEWAETLEELKSLDFDVVIPGHGNPFADRSRIDHLQAFMRDAWQRVSAAHAEGLSADEAASTVDMSDHAVNYPGIAGPGVPIATVERIYQLIEQNGG